MREVCNNFLSLHVSCELSSASLFLSERRAERSGTGCRLSSVWSWEMGTSLFLLYLHLLEPNPTLCIKSRGVGADDAWWDGRTRPPGIKFGGNVKGFPTRHETAPGNRSINFCGRNGAPSKGKTKGCAVEERSARCCVWILRRVCLTVPCRLGAGHNMQGNSVMHRELGAQAFHGRKEKWKKKKCQKKPQKQEDT